MNSVNAGPMDWFQQLPPVTRTHAAIAVGAAVAVQFTPAAGYLYLTPTALVETWQVWRLLSHVTFVKPVGFALLINVLWIVSYGGALEALVTSSPEDHLYFYIFCTGALTASSLVLTTFNLPMPFTGASLVMALIYGWSKEFSQQDISLYGIIKIKAFWMPYAFLALELVMGHSILPEVVGILIGHVWYFFRKLLPLGTGRQYLPTPDWVRKLARQLGLGPGAPGAAPSAPTGSAAPRVPVFDARFPGRGRRLNS